MEQLTQYKVILEGKGKSKEEALGSAFSTLQKKVKSETKGTPVRIEPLKVDVLEGKELESTERFLFLFMKRNVVEFYIKIEVTVNLFVVNLDDFTFEKVKDNKFFK